MEDLKYNYSKLNFVMQKSFEQQSIDENLEIFTDMIPDKAILENSIHNMNVILERSHELGSNENIIELFNQAKENRISMQQMEELNKNIQQEKYKITDTKHWEKINQNDYWAIPEECKNSEAKDLER